MDRRPCGTLHAQAGGASAPVMRTQNLQHLVRVISPV